MRKILVISLVLLITPVVEANESNPVYNFSFHNKGEKHEDSKSIDKSIIASSANSKENKDPDHNLNSGYVGTRFHTKDTIGSTSLSAGTYVKKRENLFIVYGVNFESRFKDGFKRPVGVEGKSYGLELISGFNHGSDIKKNSFFGVFHELTYGLGFYRGKYQSMNPFEYDFGVCGDYDCDLATSEGEYIFNSITYTASYKAGIKLNIALFWVSLGYELIYLNQFAGDRLPEYVFQDFEKQLSLKIELPL